MNEDARQSGKRWKWLALGAKAVTVAVVLVVFASIVFDPRSQSQVARKYPDRQQVWYWHMWTGKWREVVEGIADRFNEYQDEYEVVPLSVPNTQGNLKMLMSVAGGHPPDLMSQWNPVIPHWASLGAIRPLDEFMTPEELATFKRECYPIIWKIGSYNDRLYGLSTGMNVWAMYYRPSHFREAGLDPDRFPQTISELDAAAEKLNKFDEKSGKLVRLGHMPMRYSLHYWAPIFGGSFYDDDTGELTLDTPENMKTLRWLASFRERLGKDKVRKFEAAMQAGNAGDLDWPFITGGFSMMLDGQWRVEQMARHAPNLDYRTAPPPPADDGGKTHAGWSNGNFMVIPTGAKCPQGAWEFAKFWAGLTDIDIAAEIATQGGWLPLKPAIAEAKPYQDYLKKYPEFRTFVDMLPSENLQVSPPVIYQTILMQRISSMSEKVAEQYVTPEDGMRELIEEIARERRRFLEAAP